MCDVTDILSYCSGCQKNIDRIVHVSRCRYAQSSGCNIRNLIEDITWVDEDSCLDCVQRKNQNQAAQASGEADAEAGAGAGVEAEQSNIEPGPSTPKSTEWNGRR